MADLNGDGIPDVTIVDGAGDILFRQGVPDQPGSFEPPITINSGFPSRDIAAVNTSQGILLASVDAMTTPSRCSRTAMEIPPGGLAADRPEPAQIVSADLDGQRRGRPRRPERGRRHADGLHGRRTGRVPAADHSVGRPRHSDVSVADINQDGLPDILLANQTSGEVEVILNRGDGNFSTPTLYRAGIGLSAVVGGTGTTPLSLYSARTERSASPRPRSLQAVVLTSWHSTRARRPSAC